MPRETFNEDHGSFDISVGWDNHQSVQVGVDGGMPFSFHKDDTDDGPYTGLWYTFYSREQIDEFIKVLHRAKRKTFK